MASGRVPVRDGTGSCRTLAMAVVPFRAPLSMRIERRDDLANMSGKALDQPVDRSIGGLWRRGEVESEAEEGELDRSNEE